MACKLVRFLRLSAHPGSFINCHSRIERVFTLLSNMMFKRCFVSCVLYIYNNKTY